MRGMSPEPVDREQAAAALAELERRRSEVRSSSNTGWRLMLGWAALLLVTLPLFDHLKPMAAGIILSVAAVIGAVLSAAYGSRNRVVIRGGLRRYVLTWVLWTPWYVVLILVLVLLGHRLSFAWTLGAILAALPLAASALWERSR